jgi:hypothetical protein
MSMTRNDRTAHRALNRARIEGRPAEFLFVPEMQRLIRSEQPMKDIRPFALWAWPDGAIHYPTDLKKRFRQVAAGIPWQDCARGNPFTMP